MFWKTHIDAFFILILAQLCACTSPMSKVDSIQRMPDSHSIKLTLSSIKKNSSGGLGFTIPVTFVDVDGSKVTKSLLVDTGSSGLHILKSEISGLNIGVQGPVVVKTYGGGGKLFGHIQTLGVQFGNQDAITPIKVDVVDSAGCDSEKPKCPYKNGAIDITAYGYSGIIGIGLRASGNTVYNPLSQSSFGSYILSSCTQSLILNPLPNVKNDFNMVQLNQNGKLPNGGAAWDDKSINVCYSINGMPISKPCRPTLFDTGVTDVLIAGQVDSAVIDGIYLKPELTVKVDISNLESWTFVSKPKSTFASNNSLMFGGFDSIMGATFFSSHDVYFNTQEGLVGVKETPAGMCH